MGTNSSKITFRKQPLGTGSTHPAKGLVGTAPLGTSATHPISKTGKPGKLEKGR